MHARRRRTHLPEATAEAAPLPIVWRKIADSGSSVGGSSPAPTAPPAPTSAPYFPRIISPIPAPASPPPASASASASRGTGRCSVTSPASTTAPAAAPGRGPSAPSLLSHPSQNHAELCALCEHHAGRHASANVTKRHRASSVAVAAPVDPSLAATTAVLSPGAAPRCAPRLGVSGGSIACTLMVPAPHIARDCLQMAIHDGAHDYLAGFCHIFPLLRVPAQSSAGHQPALLTPRHAVACTDMREHVQPPLKRCARDCSGACVDHLQSFIYILLQLFQSTPPSLLLLAVVHRTHEHKVFFNRGGHQR